MKKLIYSLIAVALAVCCVFSGCSNNGGGGVNEVTDGQQNITDSKSDILIEEGESVSEKIVSTQVLAFVKGNYYLKGTLYSGGSAMPVALATDGENIQLTATVNEISFGVLILDGKTYAVQPNAKVYTELSQALIQMIGLEDEFNVDELKAIQSEEGSIEDRILQSKVTINGADGLRNEYVYDDSRVVLYSIGDELIQVESYNADGSEMTMQIAVDEFNETIPSDQLTVKGLSSVSATQFLASFA